MQQRGHEGLRVQLPFSALGRDCNGVGDVGLTTVTKLTQMGLVGKAVGQADLRQIGRGEVVQLGDEARKAGRCGIGCGQAGDVHAFGCVEAVCFIGGVCSSTHALNVAC